MNPTHELRNIRIGYGRLDGTISDDGNHVALAPIGASPPPSPQDPPERHGWMKANGWAILPRFLSRQQAIHEVQRLVKAGHPVRTFLDDQGRIWDVSEEGVAARRAGANES